MMQMYIRGFLTHKDIELLEEASIRKTKYKKCFPKKFSCSNCSYNWFYKTVKCPACSSKEIKEA
ncbi:MAG: hypothetical protein NT129_02895 [Candidatus Aenigmarchaeota archaeon]|nr:hypothetical protein [Candidatus Aenigmarchaeota archaeon]